MGHQIYGYTRDEHEYSVSVPAIMTGDADVTIYMSAHGGGTVGESYAGNGWDYAVYEGDTLILEGSDIRSPAGRPAGHAETARSLASFLSAAGESKRFGAWDSEGCAGYSATELDWLSANYERLSLFSDDCTVTDA